MVKRSYHLGCGKIPWEGFPNIVPLIHFSWVLSEDKGGIHSIVLSGISQPGSAWHPVLVVWVGMDLPKVQVPICISTCLNQAIILESRTRNH